MHRSRLPISWRCLKMPERGRSNWSGLDQARLMGPQSEIVNPLLWEIGHLAWFHEHFILRGLDRSPPRMAEADGSTTPRGCPRDALVDSAPGFARHPGLHGPVCRGRLSVVSEERASRHRRRPSSTSSSPSTRICTTRPSPTRVRPWAIRGRPSPPQPRPGTRGRVPGRATSRSAGARGRRGGARRRLRLRQ